MAEKQYYVKLSFDWGVDNGDGDLVSKNPGEVQWLSMPYEASVALQNYGVIPAINLLLERAGDLGQGMTGEEPKKLPPKGPNK